MVDKSAEKKDVLIAVVDETSAVIVEDNDFDPYLVAAFDTLFDQLRNQTNEDSKRIEDKKETLRIQSDGKDFLLLSDFGLDP